MKSGEYFVDILLVLVFTCILLVFEARCILFKVIQVCYSLNCVVLYWTQRLDNRYTPTLSLKLSHDPRSTVIITILKQHHNKGWDYTEQVYDDYLSVISSIHWLYSWWERYGDSSRLLSVWSKIVILKRHLTECHVRNLVDVNCQSKSLIPFHYMNSINLIDL